eukprot:2057388-Prymnesium_polylepis.1
MLPRRASVRRMQRDGDDHVDAHSLEAGAAPAGVVRRLTTFVTWAGRGLPICGCGERLYMRCASVRGASAAARARASDPVCGALVRLHSRARAETDVTASWHARACHRTHLTIDRTH